VEDEERPGELTWADVPRLLEELQDLARRLLTRWPGMESLQPTLLIDTALRRQRRSDQRWDEVTWENRAHFFGQVFRAMQQKLLEHRRHQQTRGYRAQRKISVAELDLFEAWKAWTEDPDLAAALQAGLERLQQDHPQLAEVVKYRFFAGLTWEDVAEMLDSSPATVKRRWKQARLLMEETIRKEMGAAITGG
jgi:DNA-directed RNA polymerase specialized sigma24 family protein